MRQMRPSRCASRCARARLVLTRAPPQAADEDRVFTVGATKPGFAAAAACAKSHQEQRVACGVLPADDVATYDASAREFEFSADAAQSYSISLPMKLSLPDGRSITLQCASQLARRVLKSECPCGGAARSSGGGVCPACSTALQVLVEDADGATHTLDELKLCGHGHGEAAELMLAVLHEHARLSDGACLPAWFSPSRPSFRAGVTLPDGLHKSYKTEVSPAANGFTSGPHAGFRAVFFFACGFPGPRPVGAVDEPRCAAPMVVRIKDDSPQHLFVDFSTGVQHRHAAGACVKLELHRGGVCSCPAYDIFPLPQPAGDLSGLNGQVLLNLMQQRLRRSGGGKDNSPVVLYGEASNAAAPLANLYRNVDTVGRSPDQWGAALKLLRDINQLTRGIHPAPPVEAGGPATSVGRLYEKLVRLQRRRGSAGPLTRAPRRCRIATASRAVCPRAT